MSTMSELHIRSQDELDYLAEVDSFNRAALVEASPEPELYLYRRNKFHEFLADLLYKLSYKLGNWASKLDKHVPF